MAFCIPKDAVENITKKINSVSMEKLFDMPKNERINFFSDEVGSSLSKNISDSFDNILAEAKRDSFEKAVKIVGIKDKEARNKILSSVRKLKDHELLDPNNDNAIISKISENITGAKVDSDEIATIIKIGSDIEKSMSIVDVTPILKDGSLNKSYSDAYKKLSIYQSEMDKFIASKIPISVSETLWGHMKALLMKPASFVVNIISNTENAALESVARRAGTLKMSGYNSKFAKDWKKMMTEIYKETGNDYSRALSIDDMITGKGKVLGEDIGIGAESWVTKVVYKYGLGAPDAWFARMSFADNADLLSSRIANNYGLKGEEAKKKALEIFSDAINIIPKTEDGKMVRLASVQSAQRATYTEKRWISDSVIAFKRLINSVPGMKHVRPGDLIEPFTKTPANVVGQGLDNAGLGFMKGFADVVRSARFRKTDEAISQEHLRKALTSFARTGISMAGSYWLASVIGKDNYMGAYDPDKTKWEQLRNSNYSAIRIGDKWISLDYLGPLGAPLVAALEARKYGGDSAIGRIGAYLKGAFTQALTIPFITSGAELYKSFSDATDAERSKTWPVMSKFFMEQVGSKVPGILGDIAKMTDTQIRDTSSGKNNAFGVNWDPVIAKIPWVASKALPEKRNMLAESISTEQNIKENMFWLGLATTLFAGARIKTEISSKEGSEIYRLHRTGNGPTITNWKYIRSEKLKSLNEKVGDEKFDSIFIEEYGPKFKESISKIIDKDNYKKASDEDKKKYIDDAEDAVMEKIYSKYKIK